MARFSIRMSEFLLGLDVFWGIFVKNFRLKMFLFVFLKFDDLKFHKLFNRQTIRIIRPPTPEPVICFPALATHVQVTLMSFLQT